MAEPITIVPEVPTNRGLDYAWLKEEGITHLQRLAGDVWTDYNEHDPGVTTLEQLCYALTELSYRAELPLAELLTDRHRRRIDPHRQALFIPRRIFPCNPLTEGDYRKLVVDRVKGVANAWFFPRTDRPEGVDGLYDVALYVPDAGRRPGAVRRRVRRLYNRHRNLCEDVRAIRILRPVRASVAAEVTIAEQCTPEAILAELFFHLGNLFAPELRRRPLKSLVDLGREPGEIFAGPLLVNGFIDDEQLQPKAKEIPVQDVVRVIVRSQGVLSAGDVKVRVGRKTYRGNQRIPVPDPERDVLRLDTRYHRRHGGFSIRLFKKGIRCRPDPARVERELDKLWAKYRRTYKLSAQYQEYFAFPKGRYRDLKQYYSVQNQYPKVYAIGSEGLPENATPARKAQARQLKGYLLMSEQLLADFFAQLAHVRDLYSIAGDLRHTYFYQPLTGLVPDVGPLLKEGYESGLSRIVHGQDAFVERRNRFLDFLLALYGEKLDAGSIPELACGCRPTGTEERLMHAKLALLDYLVRSTRTRGRGFDYLGRPSRYNVAGMEIKSRIQLGMGAFPHRHFAGRLGRPSAQAADAAAPAGELVSDHADHVEEHFATVTADGVIGSFRVGSLPGEEAVAVVFRDSSEADWRLVGRYPDRESAIAGVDAFAELMRTLDRHCQQLYIVEHNLLRFGRRWHPHHHHHKFVYSFTITAVICTCRRLRNDQDYRAYVRAVIRENTPAHIAVDYCFLDHFHMFFFEVLYWSWRCALRTRRHLRWTSARLRDFLSRHQHAGANGPEA